MKICRTCGAPMDDEAIFCPMCGAKNENNNYSNEETTVLKNGDNPFVNSVYFSQQIQGTTKVDKGKKVLIKEQLSS